MTTSVRPTREHQRRVREEKRLAHPPGWSPDGHTGPGDWMAITIALSIVAIFLIVAGIWALVSQEPTALAPQSGDAYELEQLGSFTPLVSSVTVTGDAFELERLGTFPYQLVDVAAGQGDAFELERLASPASVGDASELESLGAWTFKISDVAAAEGDASELERLGTFQVPEITTVPEGDASELERLGG